jgi:cation diffusion facilitator family transporter
LHKFAWLSIGAAVLTIGLKTLAYYLTGSVSLLSDALESLVNLAGASIAVVMLLISDRPPDELHEYGYSKAEYFSSGAEGVLILLAAATIVWTAIPRLVAPRLLEQVEIGLIVSLAAALLNFAVARLLFVAGRKHRSITLEADAQHLMTDVWTSVAVIGGVVTVRITGWARLDAILALGISANILWTGFQLVRRSALGLLDRSLPAEDQETIRRILGRYQQEKVRFHALRTRSAGRRSFISVHVLVPGNWTVQQGHDLLENVERDIRVALPSATVFTHMEPVEDPTAWQDLTLDRPANRPEN